MRGVSPLWGVARRVLFVTARVPVFRRLLLVVGLSIAAPAWADSIQTTTTERAEQVANTQQARVTSLATQRAVLSGRYAEELRDLDKLKKQRASWRRDR